MNVAGLIRPFQFFKTPEDAMTKLHVLLAQVELLFRPLAPCQSVKPGSPSEGVFPMVLLFAADILPFDRSPAQKTEGAREDADRTEGKVATKWSFPAGSIYGTITSVEGRPVLPSFASGDNNAKIEVGKGFISSVVKRGQNCYPDRFSVPLTPIAADGVSVT